MVRAGDPTAGLILNSCVTNHRHNQANTKTFTLLRRLSSTAPQRAMPQIDEIPLEILTLIFQQIYDDYAHEDISGFPYWHQDYNFWCRNTDFFNLSFVCKAWRGIVLGTVFGNHRFHETSGRTFYCSRVSGVPRPEKWPPIFLKFRHLKANVERDHLDRAACAAAGLPFELPDYQLYCLAKEHRLL